MIDCPNCGGELYPGRLIHATKTNKYWVCETCNAQLFERDGKLMLNIDRLKNEMRAETLGSTGVDAKMRQIPAEFDKLAGANDFLEERLRILEGKLQPVLREPGPVGKDETKTGETLCNYAAALRTQVLRVNMAAQYVDDLIRRLEI